MENIGTGRQEENRAGMEVLAPAGGWEALEAAVRAGADAVYLGGQAFGARANAQNFTREELKNAVTYCHQRSVKVHVTVNTLLKDRELPEALDFVEFLCGLPIDAVLVQDLGLLRLLRERAPKLPLHASTQMSLHTPMGVQLVKELGLTRAVLSRELSLEEIREISESCKGIELEAFIHGALCMCVSGQCYLSAMLGGRSGNRGQCAQPCRLPFSAKGGTGHDLSLKDLSFLHGMGRLREAGVCSAKIEGRMKRPEYVAAATRACRLAADGQALPRELTEALGAVFSRSGFTDGYLTGRLGREMFGVRRKEDVTAATGKVLASLRELVRAERQSVPVDLELSRDGETLILSAASGGTAVFVTGEERGNVGLLPPERCRQQLQKTGGTPFYPRNISVPEEGAEVSVSGLNALRREALAKLLEARGERRAIPFTPLPVPEGGSKREPGILETRAVLRSVEQVCPEALRCGELSLPAETELGDLLAVRDRARRVLLDLPRAFFGREDGLRRQMEERMEAGFLDFVCGNLGAVQLCRELGAKAHGSFSLNVTNTQALHTLAELGLESAEVSFELTGREIHALGGGLRRGAMAYGRQALMLTRNCPLKNASGRNLGGCRGCKAPGVLTDRKGARFPVVCRERGGYGVELLNSVPLWLEAGELSGLDFAVLRFTIETAEETGRVLRAFWAGEKPDGSYTRGLFRRGVE